METKTDLQPSDLKGDIVRSSNLSEKNNLFFEEKHDETKASPVLIVKAINNARVGEHVREANPIVLGKPCLPFFGYLPR